MIKDILKLVRRLGLIHNYHCSDLYLPVNSLTRRIVAKYQFKESVTKFTSIIDGDLWYDIPFAYYDQLDWWKRQKVSA